MANAFSTILQAISAIVALPVVAYLVALLLLITFQSLQTHAFYLHRVKLAWSKDLNVPEMFGFSPNQVTAFTIPTNDGVKLHAWHILPLGAYQAHQSEILAQAPGHTNDTTFTFNFRLLKDDPDARLVIYLHGAAGCMASGWRPASYRNLSSTDPNKIHVVTMDYRGYGLSDGTPSEKGLLLDAISLAEWAMTVAKIPPSRIVIFGQSLGTAVAISLAHYVARSPPTSFAGLVLVAAFTDVATLTATYRIGGVVPVLSPLARFPPLLRWFTGFVHSTWLSKDRISEFIQISNDHHLTFIHARDDRDIPYMQTEDMFSHAVKATMSSPTTSEELEKEKQEKKVDLGDGGWYVEWKSKKGIIREEISKFGFHDRIMAYPLVALAVSRAFQNADPEYRKL